LHCRRAGRDVANRDSCRAQRRFLGAQADFSRRVRHSADPRGALSPSDNAFWLIAIQLLDGVGAGIYQALTPLVIADVMHGTGRYNLAQGAVATTQGIGASISAPAAGVAVFGYSVSFLALGAAAAIAFAVFFCFMSETRDEQAIAHDRETLALEGAASS
jgi:MFS family permease